MFKIGLINILLFSILLVQTNFLFSAGYYNNKDSYSWFENHKEDHFIDALKKSWKKITENKTLWQEAIIIRNANIYALIILGFDSTSVINNVKLFQENSPLFTKHSQVICHQTYTTSWKLALNSENWAYSAKKSEPLLGTKLALKFYPEKGGSKNINALGLVKSNLVAHYAEASLELLETITKNIFFVKNPHKDLFFDPHIRNAKKLLKCK